MSKLTLITGGARSGKSSFAERLAAHPGHPVIYIATAQILDDEMALRVQRHREQRPDHWQLIEEPFDIPDVLKKIRTEKAVVLLDCVTIWLSNLMLQALDDQPAQRPPQDDQFPEKQSPDTTASSPLTPVFTPDMEAAILDRVREAAALAQEITPHVILVTNEVGHGIVPENPIARSYRDLAGRANQLLARYADKVYWVVAGYPVEVKESGQALLDSLKNPEERS